MDGDATRVRPSEGGLLVCGETGPFAQAALGAFTVGIWAITIVCLVRGRAAARVHAAALQSAA